MNFFSSRRSGNQNSRKEELERKLNETVLHWPGRNGKQPVNIARLLQGTQIFGGTGSGKSSGSGAAIAKAFLNAGYGGLVLCAKPGERKTWLDEYAKGMDADEKKRRFLIFDKDSRLQFNPLRYESERPEEEGGGQTLNLVDLLMNIHLLAQNYMSGSGGGNEMFWDNALRRCLSRTIDLLKAAGRPLSIESMRNVMISAPKEKDVTAYREVLKTLKEAESYLKTAKEQTSRDKTSKELKQASEKIRLLRQENYCLGCLMDASRNLKAIVDEKDRVKAEYTYGLVENYFMREFAFLADRTRSSIEEYFFGLVEPFLGGILKEFFMGEKVDFQLKPETTYLDNKIIIIDFSIKDYLLAGIIAAGLYKYIWQQCMERRRPLEDGNFNPVFLWADESQYFINPNYDTLFQTTARSSLVATVYLTQSINNLYFAMGSRNPEARAKALLANMGTKIFHANSDFETNHWASQMIGVKWGKVGSRDEILTAGGQERLSEQLILQVQPNRFTKLAFGREENDYEVEAIIVKTGGDWNSTEMGYLEAVFKQG